MNEDNNNLFKIIAGVFGCGCLALVLLGVGIVMLFGTLGWGAFAKRQTQIATAEAGLNLKTLADGAAAYYEIDHYTEDGLPVATRQFPTKTGKRNSRKRARVPKDIPRGTRFDVPPETWDKDPWRALKFASAQPLRYRLSYRPDNQKSGDDGFESSAEGDLDGDGVTSKFNLNGRVDQNGEVTLTPVFLDDISREFE